MQTAILKSKSKSDLKLILELAAKIGVDTRVLKDTEVQDIAFAFAIKQGRTKEYVDVSSYLKKLKSGN